MTATMRPEPERPALWGGVECTVNRVGDRYLDQLELTGHDRRLEDLDAIAGLGIRTLRYPVLWERVERTPGRFDWTWTDIRLERLRELEIEPIVGLVHHGSGPHWTNLLDDGFATGLGEFAARVAERYPWVRQYTIVNEPLTTARFSGLYGHWYPHARDDHAFVRALMVQCRAVVLGMEAIRASRPDAQLVQTEDVSVTRGARSVATQARFYSERAWLSFDLLCGHVTPGHALYVYLRESGADDAALEFFVARSRPPDLLGLNYYVASDRYLDDALDRYPPERHHHAPLGSFVDAEAARSPSGIAGHRAHLSAAWRRYGRPLAITEVHLDCTAEDQLRWFVEAWEAACEARGAGIPVEAVTAWALFGSMDWDSLVTRSAGYYERGAFDVGGDVVRRRALADAITAAAHGRAIDHPAASGRGWWRRGSSTVPTAPAQRKLLIAGRGTLGRALARACDARGLAYTLVSRSELDIADSASIARALSAIDPWAVINACGYVRVDDAEGAVDACWRANVIGPALLADAMATRKVPFVTFSSDLVFDGELTRPYVEDDRIGPLSVYGRSKAAAETEVLTRWPKAVVIRTAAFFGPEDDANFLTTTLRHIHAGCVVHVAGDVVVSPTYVPDLAAATLELLIDGASGVWHLANSGSVSWWEWARSAAGQTGADVGLVRQTTAARQPNRAPRPRFSALASTRGALMPSLDSAMDRYVRDVDRRHLYAAIPILQAG